MYTSCSIRVQCSIEYRQYRYVCPCGCRMCMTPKEVDGQTNRQTDRERERDRYTTKLFVFSFTSILFVSFVVVDFVVVLLFLSYKLVVLCIYELILYVISLKFVVHHKQLYIRMSCAFRSLCV